jgi:hypothetical protein
MPRMSSPTDVVIENSVWTAFPSVLVMEVFGLKMITRDSVCDRIIPFKPPGKSQPAVRSRNPFLHALELSRTRMT